MLSTHVLHKSEHTYQLKYSVIHIGLVFQTWIKPRHGLNNLFFNGDILFLL